MQKGFYKNEVIIPQNYKTSMCEHWLKLGNCKFGDKCLFAHGETEIKRSFSGLTDKRSTIPCRNIELYGFCKYEETCYYSHTYPQKMDIVPKKIFSGKNLLSEMFPALNSTTTTISTSVNDKTFNYKSALSKSSTQPENAKITRKEMTDFVDASAQFVVNINNFSSKTSWADDEEEMDWDRVNEKLYEEQFKNMKMTDLAEIKEKDKGLYEYCVIKLKEMM